MYNLSTEFNTHKIAELISFIQSLDLYKAASEEDKPRWLLAYKDEHWIPVTDILPEANIENVLVRVFILGSQPEEILCEDGEWRPVSLPDGLTQFMFEDNNMVIETFIDDEEYITRTVVHNIQQGRLVEWEQHSPELTDDPDDGSFANRNYGI